MRPGVDHSLLIAVRAGGRQMKYNIEIPYEQVADYCRRDADELLGPRRSRSRGMGMEQLRDLEYAVRELGFVGAHSYPHWFRLPPDAPQWYPIYAKCCELDIPIMMQVGQNLIYQKDVRLPSVARPILLDQIAIDFPGAASHWHPRGHPLGGRDDRHGLEARERFYRHRRLRTQASACLPGALHE
jgi:predicted TIM-barrel fold metal-dependent hydrolase